MVSNDSELIWKFFPDIDKHLRTKIVAMEAIYKDLNSKINVISRKDIDHLYERHILHSLAIERFIDFLPGDQVLDLGTGGGFPGIPLAILNPDTHFTLIDGTGKKIAVVREVIAELALNNVTAIHTRSEEHSGRYQYIVSRAVGPVSRLIGWSQHLISEVGPAGWIFLKGGDLSEELKGIPRRYRESQDISQWFDLPFFDNKKVLFIDSRAILP